MTSLETFIARGTVSEISDYLGNGGSVQEALWVPGKVGAPSCVLVVLMGLGLVFLSGMRGGGEGGVFGRLCPCERAPASVPACSCLGGLGRDPFVPSGVRSP